MKKLITIIICCWLGYLLYPVVQPITTIIRNPPPENVERFFLDCVVEHHFEAFGGVILKLSNPEGKEAFWAYGNKLGLPPAGHSIPLVIDRLQIPLLNGYFFLYRVSNDTKKENIQRINELYE